jgi:hypothetical protein
MSHDEFDVHPILHKNRIYNIITSLDLSFVEVRAMLDWLAANNAFPQGTVEAIVDAGEEAEETDEGESGEGEGRLYTCTLPGVVLEVDVLGYDVVVYRRNET